MTGWIKEFRDFVARGNVIDLAVGIIIGAAFGKIVSSTVNDVLMPPIGKALGNVNFNDLFISLDSEKTKGLTSLADVRKAGAPVIAYGAFLQSLIDFLIVAFCVFLLVKAINRVKTLASKPTPAAAPTTRDCPHCLSTVPIKAIRCAHCTSDLK